MKATGRTSNSGFWIVWVVAVIVFLVMLVQLLRGQTTLVGVGQACMQTTTGNIIVSPFLMNEAPLSPFKPAPASSRPPTGPKKIVLSEDLPGSVLICRDTYTGTTCKTLDALFGKEKP